MLTYKVFLQSSFIYRELNSRVVHDAVSVGCGLHALQPLALAVVSVRAFCAVAHTRVRGIIVFVRFLVKNLTL